MSGWMAESGSAGSGVHYMHLVDHARSYIEETYKRPWHDRLLRSLLAQVLPYPGRFRFAWPRPCWRSRSRASSAPAALRRSSPGDDRTGAAPGSRPARPSSGPGEFRPGGASAGAASRSCPGAPSRSSSPASTKPPIRLLNRHGIEVVQARRERVAAARSSTIWAATRRGSPSPGATSTPGSPRWTGEGLDAIVDHRLRLRHHHQGLRLHVPGRSGLRREGRARLRHRQATSPNTCPASSLMAPVRETDLVVAYHSACSMQHGQQIRDRAQDAAQAARASP